MPLAGSKLLGTTVLYVGPTTDTYSTGVCYTCKATESSSYYWEAVASGGEYTLTKEVVDGVIGASVEGSTAKFYNEQGAFTEVDMSGYLPLSGGTLTGTLNVGDIQADNSLSIGVGDYGGVHLSTIYMGQTNASISSRFGVSIRSSHGYIDLDSITGVRINEVKAATVDDISTHNTDATAHTNLFALKVDTETYNTAITAINAALDGKENTGVAQGLVDAHNESATAHEALFEVKADKTELELLQPAGTVIAFAGNSAPDGYLICNGAAVSRTTYDKLFAIIGTTYGTGDGSTTFNLPNLTDKFIMGSGTAGTSKAAGLPNITGQLLTRPPLANTTAGTGALYYGSNNTEGYAAPRGDSSTTNQIFFNASRSNSIYGSSTTVQPPALTMRFYIKY